MRWCLSYILLICVNCLSYSALAQVFVNGTINHRGAPVRDVEIIPIVNGRESVPSKSNFRGKFEIELPNDALSKLVFRSKNSVPLTVVVDSRILDGESNTTDQYEIPLNVEMFYFFESIVTSLNFDDPFGFIKKKGTGSLTFQFEPNDKIISDLISYKEQSHALEDQNLEPDLFTSIEKTLPSEETEIKEVKNTIVEDNNKQRQTEVDAKKLRSEALIETKLEVLEAQRQELTLKKEVSESSKDFELNAQQAGKANKAEAYSHRLKQNELKVDVMAESYKNDEKLAEAAGAVSRMNEALEEVTLINHEKYSNYFFAEEKLRFKRGNDRFELTKSTYNWIFFVSEYYYLNDLEITRDRYEVERAEVL